MERVTATREFLVSTVLAGTILAGAIPVSILPAQQPPAKRTYESGPLTVSDFAGQSDAEEVRKGTSAYTVCELRWKYDSRWQEMSDGQVLMKVSKLTFECLVDPQKSWNLKPQNEALLGHEQGHFELWYINTLRARVAWQKKRGEGGIEVTGASRKECETLLDKEVNAFCKEFVDAARDENADYDRTTAKGTSTTNQAEARRVHQATIKQLEGQLRPDPRKSK